MNNKLIWLYIVVTVTLLSGTVYELTGFTLDMSRTDDMLVKCATAEKAAMMNQTAQDTLGDFMMTSSCQDEVLRQIKFDLHFMAYDYKSATQAACYQAESKSPYSLDEVSEMF